MISSTANKQVRRVVNLVKKAKTRREEDLYVVEGIRMVSELVPEQTEQIYVSESFLKNKAREELLSGFSWEAVSDPVMKTMADTQTPQGILALVKQKHYSLGKGPYPDSGNPSGSRKFGYDSAGRRGCRDYRGGDGRNHGRYL